MKYKEDSFGIYDRGTGNYKDTINKWGKQREGIVERLNKFAKRIGVLKEACDILDEAKKNNPRGLIF